MVDKKQAEVRTVKWFLITKNPPLIKFVEGEDESYPLADNVVKANNFAKFPIVAQDKVEVSIADKKVTFLRKVKNETSKQEEKTSEPVKETTEVKSVSVEQPVISNEEIVTVDKVTLDKGAVKFVEKVDIKWYNIKEDIRALDYTVIGLVANQKVKVVLEGKNLVKVVGKIESIPPVVTEEVKKESPKSSSSTKTSYVNDKDAFYRIKELERQVRYLENEKQVSIEAQASVNSACEIVSRIGASMTEKPSANTINTMIEAIARKNYALIQSLKMENKIKE